MKYTVCNRIRCTLYELYCTLSSPEAVVHKIHAGIEHFEYAWSQHIQTTMQFVQTYGKRFIPVAVWITSSRLLIEWHAIAGPDRSTSLSVPPPGPRRSSSAVRSHKVNNTYNMSVPYAHQCFWFYWPFKKLSTSPPLLCLMNTHSPG